MHFLKTLIGTRKGTTSKGISQLKKYLSHFGYMNRKDTTTLTHQTDDLFDDDLELAVKNYQTFFKLAVNGIMDANTLETMSSPRCGVPDTFNLNRSHELYLRIPTLASHYVFFPGEPKWPPTKRSLTYSFPSDGQIDIISGSWGWEYIDGPKDFSAPSDGRLHFDGDEKWVDGVTPGAFDLQTVGLHELGHVLGLGHTNDSGAVMYPYIGDGLRKVLTR
ncbi:UNVERIFIED_CONTAM: Metalloendoproteinase 3-MMP [Sesamum calycinum]|uniref:Metalloendoproteinase 3-MMP n=1 Tax=Sesamum calycinum TaxID=2727403 RepID=A0AAW2NGT2_9LAMI